MKSKKTAVPPERRPRRVATGPEATLARHRAQCRICRHSQRDAIEREFLDWAPGREIAAEYKLGSYRAVYRHAHALGLFRARRGHVARALDNIIERAGEAKITAASVVSAIRLLVKLETSFDHRSALAHLRRASEENAATRLNAAAGPRVPGDEEDWEEDCEEGKRASAHPCAAGGATDEDDADDGEMLTGSAGESKEGQFKVKSSKPSDSDEKKTPRPAASAVPSPARAPIAPEPGTRREPDGPPNVAGMAWWPNGRSPFARRGRWGRRPVVG